MSLSSPFNYLLSLRQRPMKLKVVGKNDPSTVASVDIFATPSNYNRNLAGISDTVIAGHEFIISKEVLSKVSLDKVSRGDILIDDDYGTLRITEVIRLVDFGGSVMGYRVRTS